MKINPGVTVLLINPKISESSQSGIINSLVNITFPTSLGVIAGYLMSFGLNGIDIIDEQIYPTDDRDLPYIINSLQKPKIIGISVLTLNSGRAYELADKIKHVDPETILVLGGIHPTVVAEEVLGRRSIDIIVRGEGEETFKELVDSILNRKDYRSIRGISYKEDVRCIHNPDRPLLDNLDAVPPFPYHLFEKDLDKYPNFSGIFSSRGCPYRCSFCSSRNVSGRKYRYHSVERIINEIKILVHKYRQESVFFYG